jgi:CheY-like chemotaxis protein
MEAEQVMIRARKAPLFILDTQMEEWEDGSSGLLNLETTPVASLGILEPRVPGREDGKQDGLLILVVDDNVDGALSQAILLRLAGHRVEIATDGPTAVALGQAIDPDVVLLDIGLPGMDGWEVAKSLYAHVRIKRPFIIAVTGHGRAEDVRQSSKVGIDLHLVKPIDPQELEAVLRRFQRVIQ